jgi:Cu+-exporting ATPase
MIMLLLMLPMACKRSGQGTTEPVSLTLDVQGMTCGSCEQAIQREVSRLPGVLSVKASVADKKTWITFKVGQVTRETIITTINALGYKASLAPGQVQRR